MGSVVYGCKYDAECMIIAINFWCGEFKVLSDRGENECLGLAVEGIAFLMFSFDALQPWNGPFRIQRHTCHSVAPTIFSEIPPKKKMVVSNCQLSHQL